jgi:uncharacterized protein
MPVPDRPETQSTGFDTRTLELLACPVCRGELRAGSPASQIHCLACGRLYPLIEGIPVLIPERAVDLEMPRSDGRPEWLRFNGGS